MSRFNFIAFMTGVVAASLAGCSKPPAANAEHKLLSSNGTPVATAPAPGGAGTPAAPASAAQPAAGQTPAIAPAPASPKPMPAQLPDVLARVNGEAISKTDFERALQSIEQRAGGPVPVDRRDEIYRGLLDQLVGLKLLSQEAATRKIAVPDTEVDARIDAIKKQFPSEEVFKQQLTAQKVTIDKLRADQRADLAIAKMLETAIKDKVTATPDQVIAFYQQNPTRFQQTERVRASHILLTVPQNTDDAAKAKIRAKAEDLLKQVKAGGDFAALAKEHSQDPGSAINGGDLGFLQQGQTVPPFNEAVFKLAPGAVSGVVETQFGFHIIKVVEKQPARTVPLDEVKDQVKQFLENTNKQRETQAFVASLRSKGKVEVLV